MNLIYKRDELAVGKRGSVSNRREVQVEKRWSWSYR